MKIVIVSAVVLVLAWGAAYAFRWEYHEVRTVEGAVLAVRTDRWTGRAERLTRDGWKPLGPAATAAGGSAPLPPCTPEERAQHGRYADAFCGLSTPPSTR